MTIARNKGRAGIKDPIDRCVDRLLERYDVAKLVELVCGVNGIPCEVGVAARMACGIDGGSESEGEARE